MLRRYLLFCLVIFCLVVAGVVGYHQWQWQHNQGQLIVSVTGGNATIYLNEQFLGEAPIKNYTAPSGFYQLSIATDGYTFTTPLYLSPRTATVIDWRLQTTVEQSSGLIYELTPLADEKAIILTIASLPDRAAVVIDNQETTQFAPLTLPNPTNFTPTITFSLPGYDNLIAQPTLTPGYQLKVTAKLARETMASF